MNFVTPESGKSYFTKHLLQWNKKTNNRPMPWKGEKDPYKIWLSEIILQQTRVEQGWNYYNRFVAAFPNVKKLANAPGEKVFKLWEGLGYYTRCKNLLVTAKFIANENKGVFPGSYTEILQLKGVGPYTAAAIASFAFDLPHAVVDGNVFRVLSRFFGIAVPPDTSAGKQLFGSLAQSLLDKKQPGIYNQAIMDFGAVICKPKNPQCNVCPLKSKCVALAAGKVDILPVKSARLIKKERWFYYFVASYQGKIFIRKRGPKDIWENLYEFILLEEDHLLEVEKIRESGFFKTIAGRGKTNFMEVSRKYKQQLTHQTIHGIFLQLKLKAAPSIKDYKGVTYNELLTLPFPRLVTSYLSENDLEAFVR